MISVIIPLYNKEAIVEKSLKSVLSQDYDDFEVIVVNDGSTDNSAEIVKSIKDPRLHLIEQENGGPSKARNVGVQNAKGEWVYLIDADDEMEPGTLSYFYGQSLKFTNIDMFLGEVYIDDGKRRRLAVSYKNGTLRNIFKAHAFSRLFQCSGSTLYRKEICVRYPYNENIRRYEDLESLFNKYRLGKLYTMHRPVAKINTEYASASHGRKDISEDFVGHLDFKGKSFWEKMCLYKLFIEEREHYPQQCKELYPSLYKRWDMYFIYQLIKKTNRIRNVFK